VTLRYSIKPVPRMAAMPFKLLAGGSPSRQRLATYHSRFHRKESGCQALESFLAKLRKSVFNVLSCPGVVLVL
jgi:hypothetical protein